MMDTGDVVTFARRLYPQAAIDLLCRDGTMSDGDRDIIIGGRMCCIVGALNVATVLADGGNADFIYGLPSRGAVLSQYEYARPHQSLGLLDRMRLRKMIDFWDVANEPGDHEALFAALCAEVTP